MNATLDLTEFRAISQTHMALAAVSEGLRLLTQLLKPHDLVVADLHVKAELVDVTTFGGPKQRLAGISSTWVATLIDGADTITIEGISWDNLAKQVNRLVEARP